NKWAMDYLEVTRDSVFLRAWLYLLLTLVLALGSFVRLRSRETVLPLALSVYLYAFAYFFVTPTGAFRYIWWSVLGSLLVPFTFRAELRSPAAPPIQPPVFRRSPTPLQSGAV